MTMIDKAEALALIDRKLGKDHPALADELRHAIRALPARGVGDAYEAGLQTALGLIGSIGYGKNEDVDRGHEEAFRAVAKHLQDLRDAKSAALAPTDAAQAREAALRTLIYAAKAVLHDLHHGNGLEGLYENRDRLEAAIRAMEGRNG